jgi:sulfur relay (sulfurtransferase) DsrC/TusE family protein
MDIPEEDLAIFIKRRLDEVRRMNLSLSVSEDLPVQAATDQLGRLIDSVDAVVTYVRYYKVYSDYEESPLILPILKKIANNWSYHEDFQDSWR